jgi:hypothetical protein
VSTRPATGLARAGARREVAALSADIFFLWFSEALSAVVVERSITTDRSIYSNSHDPPWGVNNTRAKVKA